MKKEYMFHDPKTNPYALGGIFASDLKSAKSLVRKELGYKRLTSVSVWEKKVF